MIYNYSQFPSLFDDTHYARTFLQKGRLAFHLGPTYFFWDLPGYFLDRLSLGLPVADFPVFLNPLAEFTQYVYQHFELPPYYEHALRILAANGISLTMPRARLEPMLGAWWATVDIPGDVIECGSFRGATALLLALLGALNNRPQQTLIFDTFEGIPDVTRYDKSRSAGEFIPPKGQAVIIQQQAVALGISDRIEVYEGLFANTFRALEQRTLTFAFVHIDANIYIGTRDACRFAIPRTHNGGIVVFDDYNGVCDLGARLAIDEYFTPCNVKPRRLAGSAVYYCK